MRFGDIAKLNELNRGMSQLEVQQILGKPKQKEVKAMVAGVETGLPRV